MCWHRTGARRRQDRDGSQGVGRFEVFIKGVLLMPAPARGRPQRIRELGNVIQTLEAMNDLARGITVNVGVVRGGTKPNVVAEEAYAEVDLRVPTISDSDELTAKILKLKSRTEGVTVKVIGELNRPPYEKSNAGAALRAARTNCAEIVFALSIRRPSAAPTQFQSADTATLDGLGFDGQGALPSTSRCHSSSSRERGCCIFVPDVRENARAIQRRDARGMTRRHIARSSRRRRAQAPHPPADDRQSAAAPELISGHPPGALPAVDGEIEDVRL